MRYKVLLLVFTVVCASCAQRERNKFRIQQMEREAERNEEVNQMKFRLLKRWLVFPLKDVCGFNTNNVN
ncbi:hypothetical protein PZH42_30455 [Bacteroides cellulosilyticus]|uniref:Uncharacterized protein n=1 Tax=Bacteroides cellulosilyticus TaxID=246787 RepID=A0AAW6M984_9BACE|nr:hypothetical protein [Bacteroides cellulosilyticus]MDE8698266.1 hypothetical protein [Bacteroides cellulosilyticus]